METREVGNSGVWIKASEAIPARYMFFAGAETSRDVLVQYKSGEQGVDRVHYPHGAFGGSREPNFVMRHYSSNPDDQVEYWLDYIIPSTPDEED